MQREFSLSNCFVYLEEFIKALRPLRVNNRKKLNIEKFREAFRLSHNEMEGLLEIVLELQKLFLEEIFGYFIKLRWQNGTRYVTIESMNELSLENSREIILSQEEAVDIADIVHFFQHVKIGSGFDLNLKKSELNQKVKKLHSNHPYFFMRRGNGLLYPTPLTLALGKEILIFKKLNKLTERIYIEDFAIQILRGRNNG